MVSKNTVADRWEAINEVPFLRPAFTRGRPREQQLDNTFTINRPQNTSHCDSGRLQAWVMLPPQDIEGRYNGELRVGQYFEAHYN